MSPLAKPLGFGGRKWMEVGLTIEDVCLTGTVERTTRRGALAGGKTPASWTFSLATALLLVRLLDADDASFSGGMVEEIFSLLTNTLARRYGDHVSMHDRQLGNNSRVAGRDVLSESASSRGWQRQQ